MYYILQIVIHSYILDITDSHTFIYTRYYIQSYIHIYYILQIVIHSYILHITDSHTFICTTYYRQPYIHIYYILQTVIHSYVLHITDSRYHMCMQVHVIDKVITYLLFSSRRKGCWLSSTVSYNEIPIMIQLYD